MDINQKIPEEDLKLGWIEEEEKQYKESMAAKGGDFEKLPNMKFEENKITDIEIIFQEKFKTWVDKKEDGREVPKAIVPILHNKEKKNWWISKFNPIYWDLLNKAKKGQTKFKILRTGQMKDTRYMIVE